MNDEKSLERNTLGMNMDLVFRYVQQIFRETAQLMKKLDSLIGKDWTPTYGNRTTTGVTSHIDDPDYWLVHASFRIYNSKNALNIKKGISIVYWNEGCDQPILIAGKLDYILDSTNTGPKGHDYWDLYYAWFSEDYKDRKTDGTIYQTKYESENDYIKQAIVFAIPLVSIQSEDDIRTKIYDKLITL